MEAYGVYDEGSKRIEIWARCHGEDVEVQRITWEQMGDDRPGWDVLGPHVASLVFFKPTEPT